jgi:predicted Zn-dependent protease
MDHNGLVEKARQNLDHALRIAGLSPEQIANLDTFLYAWVDAYSARDAHVAYLDREMGS